MTFKEPSVADVAKAFPDIEDIAYIQKGGFKAVYSAKAKSKKLALKLVFIPPVVNPKSEEQVLIQKEMKGRIRRELDLLAKLKCPEVVKLSPPAPRDVQIGGTDYISYAEEYLEGSTLWDVIVAGGAKPTEDELRALFTSLIYAIEAMWALKAVHRDIKPGNIIKLNDPKRPFVLLDLGIAFVIGETGLTNAGFPRTNRYMAPEMIHPSFRETLDYRSDLYTTALTVYEYAAQRHPIAGSREDQLVTISRAVHDIPAPLHSHRADLDSGFCETIDQLLKKKPSLRPANLKALLAKAGKAT